MTWGTVELEAEVRAWLEGLPTDLFARAAFYVDLLTERGPLLSEPYTKQIGESFASCVSGSIGMRCGSVTGLPPIGGSSC
ncbi:MULTISPECIES: hypothetical protein [unclassified Kribbella]|uniref:hypothetical protein n=1 Tax=unclassified Kribbella TaxID=2644121 RepID=UPI0033D147C4